MSDDPTPLPTTDPLDEDGGRALVESWRASGLSGAAFCRANSLRPQRLHYWRERLGYPIKLVRSSAMVSPVASPGIEQCLSVSGLIQGFTKFAGSGRASAPALMSRSIPVVIVFAWSIAATIYFMSKTTAGFCRRKPDQQQGYRQIYRRLGQWGSGIGTRAGYYRGQSPGLPTYLSEN